MTIRPRRPLHTGSVLASGLAIPTSVTGEANARARLLRHPGADVFCASGFLIVRFAEPLRLEAAMAAGALLVRYGRLLSMAPLEADEAATLAPHEDTAVLVTGGVAEPVALSDAIREDASQWIDVSAFAVIDGLKPLGRVEAMPEASLPPPAKARDVLGVAPLDRASAQLLQALLTREPTGASDRKMSRPARSWRLPITPLLFEAIRRLSGLAALFGPGANSNSAPARTPGVSSNSSAAPGTTRPSLLFRLQALSARFLWSSPLSRLLANQHARALTRLMAMFDSNDLDNALRHALPLSNELEAALSRLPLWTLLARKDFGISPARAGARTSLGLGGDLFSALQSRYRRAFERLEAAGEIEKAAFVLAELLNANEEAVQFLERHGRLRLAAEVAEGRKVAPGIVVRQWFLAGDRARAIRMARLTGAFPDALSRLLATHKREADMLRLLWADTLASGGNYAAAVDALWPVEDARPVAGAWIDRAIAAGGLMGARMLARKAQAYPERFPETLERSQTLLAGEGEDERAAAKEFGRALTVAGEVNAGTRLLARLAARSLMARSSDFDALLVQQLIRLSGDPLLQVDLGNYVRALRPSGGHVAPLSQRSKPLEIKRSADDKGGLPICDAAALPGGRMLIAAGEAGVLLLSREGKIIKRFGEPAQHIVISDLGDRAILVARRGEILRLSRLDVVEGRVRGWCDARVTKFAPDFDGLTWFVARGGAVYAVDATAPKWAHLWKVDEERAFAASIQRNADAMSVLFDRPAHARGEPRCHEVWTYQLPSLTLRHRVPIHNDDPLGRFLCVIAPSGGALTLREGEGCFTSRLIIGSQKSFSVPSEGTPHGFWLTDSWIAVSGAAENGLDLSLLDRTALQVRAKIRLEGHFENSCRIRLQGDHLLVFDAGRVFAVSLQTGTVTNEHRLTV